MITTHWTRACQPRERDLRLLDIIARQAADLIERNISAQALRLQAQHLLEADRYKNEFLATLAHELRNPLAPIRNGLVVLKIGRPEQAPPVLSMMERQVGHMVRLIDDLLDVSRISRGTVTLRRARMALSTAIDSAVETSRPLINAAGHHFTVAAPAEPVWLDADLTRVAQIGLAELGRADVDGQGDGVAGLRQPRGGLAGLVQGPVAQAHDQATAQIGRAHV